MYTQCNHCKAIFRVTMKELTAAQGLLRCGECDAIFDAMKSLSTTLPEERRFAQNNRPTPPTEEQLEDIEITPLNKQADKPSFWERFKSKSQHTSSTSNKAPPKSKSTSGHFLAIGIAALVLLLLLQLLYSGRNWLAQQPLTANFTQQACEILGCTFTVPRDVRKVSLLSRNVYSHPNTPDVLTISAVIQNDASFRQPYPLIEISFLNSENQVVALRRFTPEEYIQNFSQELMSIGIPKELVLNISDPGQEAVRFRFRFI